MFVEQLTSCNSHPFLMKLLSPWETVPAIFFPDVGWYVFPLHILTYQVWVKWEWKHQSIHQDSLEGNDSQLLFGQLRLLLTRMLHLSNISYFPWMAFTNFMEILYLNTKRHVIAELIHFWSKVGTPILKEDSNFVCTWLKFLWL